MAAKRLTDAAVRALKPKAERYTVAEGAGFGLMVYPNGAKSWLLRYTAADGRRRPMILGSYPDMSLTDARAAAAAARAQLAAGADPLDQRRETRDATRAQAIEQRRAPTLAEAFADYMALNVRPRLRRPQAIERDIGAYVLPELGTLKLADLRRVDVLVVLDGIRARGALHQAEMVRSRFATFLNWCAERDLIEASPIAGLKPLHRAPPRERALCDDELHTLWGWLASGATSGNVRDALRLILLTGQRPGEVLGLPWSELDLPARLWYLPAARTKNGRAHTVPLGRLALDILEARRATAHGPFVFPGRGTDGTLHGQSLANLLRRSLAGSPAAGLAPFRPHDLRRTCRTGLARLGVADEVGERVLNHHRGGLVAVYNRHRYEAEMRAALDAWDRHLCRLIGQASGANVVPLHA
ncbi:integrase [Plasticicumulans acidivorans]|uniref:Integrase n=2 Tax=Plasticicumulans acidivorans TaxID=886464 RepID=A0A317MZ74_9GAMM|nr:integrase [Plasticicumulans acidivorans]